MSSGLTIYGSSGSKKSIRFSTKYPAFLIDRTNNYGYANYDITFGSNPALPPNPPLTPSGSTTVSYQNLMKIYHGLGRIPAYETVTTGLGLPNPPSWNQGIQMWNENATISIGGVNPLGFVITGALNVIAYSADANYFYIDLIRQAVSTYSGKNVVVQPYSLAGVELKINVQIFAMGLDDIQSQV